VNYANTDRLSVGLTFLHRLKENVNTTYNLQAQIQGFFPKYPECAAPAHSKATTVAPAIPLALNGGPNCSDSLIRVLGAFVSVVCFKYYYHLVMVKIPSISLYWL
jgi:hypothetical protein